MVWDAFVALDGAAVDEDGRVGDAGHIGDVMVRVAGTPAGDAVGLTVRCPGCGAYLGRVLARKGRPYLDDGRFLILTDTRGCHACRRWFHWHGEKLGMADFRAGGGERNGGVKRL